MMALRLASEEQRNMLVSNCLWPKLEQIEIRRYTDTATNVKDTK